MPPATMMETFRWEQDAQPVLCLLLPLELSRLMRGIRGLCSAEKDMRYHFLVTINPRTKSKEREYKQPEAISSTEESMEA